MTTSQLRNSIHGSLQLCGLLLVSLLLTCFALPQRTQAVVPAPDGGYGPPTYGAGNTAEGQNALLNLTTGEFNTAVGSLSLRANTTNSRNTAIGAAALLANTADRNTATGAGALLSNTTGPNNTANGASALSSNTEGSANTATGDRALRSNTTGDFNTAFGFGALFNNVSGNLNTAIGSAAGADIRGSGNVCIGAAVHGVAGESNTTRIRNVYSSFASARAVYVNSDNKIGTLMSSRRFKHEIKPMDKASETILALKPVTFRYKKEIEPNSAIMFGLIAEEVEKVAPELVTRNDKGEVETVRYEAVNAMLLNEFLKEHRKNEKQEATIAELKAEIATLATTMKEHAAQMQKVNAQLEVIEPAPRVVLTN